jgi:hypothetical protein
MKKRGGKREGAGRKPGKSGPKGSLTLWLTADVAAFLETFGSEKSDHVDKTLRKSAAYKTWLKSQRAECSKHPVRQPAIDNKAKIATLSGG